MNLFWLFTGPQKGDELNRLLHKKWTLLHGELHYSSSYEDQPARPRHRSKLDSMSSLWRWPGNNYSCLSETQNGNWFMGGNLKMVGDHQRVRDRSYSSDFIIHQISWSEKKPEVVHWCSGKTTLWVLWRHMNEMVFNNQKPNNLILLDNVKTLSYTWIKNRDWKLKIGWSEWMSNLKLPLCKSVNVFSFPNILLAAFNDWFSCR